MTPIEIKQRLIDRIKETTDNSLLEELYRILSKENDDSTIYMLSEQQKVAIRESRKDIENGRVITHEQANTEIEEWLKK
ncbi:MAG: hypothetical protein EPN39_15700 [Chitinophagaceae bacterium]|jgi:predicted transcriptional regulator|nr:MAG: hypothetical protein EPN39_15700 [Chitinophagaceae bacterium]